MNELISMAMARDSMRFVKLFACRDAREIGAKKQEVQSINLKKMVDIYA